jgi:hypothetical protein
MEKIDRHVWTMALALHRLPPLSTAAAFLTIGPGLEFYKQLNNNLSHVSGG